MVLSNLILKSTEKEDIGFVKIKSIEVEDLHEFLSEYDTNSNKSAGRNFISLNYMSVNNSPIISIKMNKE